MFKRLALFVVAATASHPACAADWPVELDRMHLDMRNPIDQGRATSIIVAARPKCQGNVDTKELEVLISPAVDEALRKGMAEGKALAAIALASDHHRLCRWIIERFGRHGSVMVDLRVRSMSDDVLGDHWAGLSSGRRIEEIASNGLPAHVDSNPIKSDVMSCVDWMVGTKPGANKDTILIARSTPLNKIGIDCRARIARKDLPWKGR